MTIKDVQQTLDQIEQCRLEAHKQIEENPFILQKVGFFWRLSAWMAGVKNPKSQAQYMKDKIDKMAAEHRKTILENATEYFGAKQLFELQHRKGKIVC